MPLTATYEQVHPAQTIQELETAQKQHLVMEHGTSAVTCVAFSPQGNIVASASNNTIGLWGVETGGLLRTLKAQGEIEEMAFSANGAMIAGSGQNGMIWVWKAKTGMLVRKWRAKSGAVKCVAFSPTEPLLAASGDKGAVLLWDVMSGKLNKVLHGIYSPHSGARNGYCASNYTGINSFDTRVGPHVWPDRDHRLAPRKTANAWPF